MRCRLPTALLVLAVAVARARGATLEEDIRAVVAPELQRLSSQNGNASWAFAFVDNGTSVQLCAGYSDPRRRVPCQPDDLFAWGSTTKPTTAVLVLRLVERGIVQLDDPAARHIDPYLRAMNHSGLRVLFGPAAARVTVRQLLQMTAGVDEFDTDAVRQWQNADEHRAETADPMWVLHNMNRTLLCEPGTCGKYSSTNYMLLGLVLARYQPPAAGAAGNFVPWQALDQRAWIPAAQRARGSMSSFHRLRYGVSGVGNAFGTADGAAGPPANFSAGLHGFQHVCGGPGPHSAAGLAGPVGWGQGLGTHGGCVWPNQSDVANMSLWMGWTCGNMVAPVGDAAAFFWQLLGPPSRAPSSRLLAPASLREMTRWRYFSYWTGRGGEGADVPGAFGYGLGLMNFTSMTWGFQYDGEFLGHNGLTYGFGAQSGYNVPLEFGMSMVTNAEHWIGPDARGEPNALYAVLVAVVRRHRKDPLR